MFRRAQIFLICIAASMGALAVAAAIIFGHPLVDPDGFLGPSAIRLPLLVSMAFLIDLVPRTLWVSRLHPSRMREAWRARFRQHWTKPRATLVVTGLLSFYVTYVSYRNLKSELPFVEGEGHKFDYELMSVDRAVMLGHAPGPVLHDLLGTGVAAQVLSTVYLWFLPLVPLCLTAWLIWSKDFRHGYWFATSQCIAWTLGTVSYYALPTLGPGIYQPWLYDSVGNPGAVQLMGSITWTRQYFLSGVSGYSLQSIAGFASLHVAITVLVALMVQYTTPWRTLKVFIWINTCATAVSTIYFGWHYISDDVAGVAIALIAFYVGGWAAGQTFSRHRVPMAAAAEEQVTTV